MKTAEEVFDIHRKKWSSIKQNGNWYPKQMVIEAIEEYASQPKWISVEERLPDVLQRVMCHDDVNDMYFDCIYNGGDEFIMKVQGQFVRMRVSHWQPLTTPPTK